MFHNKMIVFVGPAGSGKTTLAQAAVKLGALEVVSTTTRPARPDECNGVHYHFVNTTIFERMIQDHHLVEHAQYDGNYYGVAKMDLNFAILQSPIGVAVCVMEIVGFKRVAELYPDMVVGVFVDTDRETVKRRLYARSELSEDRRERRLALYDRDYEHKQCFEDGSLKVPHFIVDNTTLDPDQALPKLLKEWLA